MTAMEHNYILIVAGGTGSRLWPLSRRRSPKQFHKLFHGQSLFQQMAGRSARLVGWHNVVVVCPEHLMHHVFEQAPQLSKGQVICEPEQRDNFPAIVLGVDAITQKDPAANIAVLWSDHYIFTEELFSDMILGAFAHLVNRPKTLLAIGTAPTYPETGFGYIKKGKQLGDSLFSVQMFTEKPDIKRARRFVRSGAFFWNTGYKALHGKTFLNDIRSMYDIQGLGGNDLFAAVPAGSIEDRYTNQKEDLAVLCSDMRWSDVGNWKSLDEITLGMQDTKTPCVAVSAKNISATARQKPVVVVGVDDVIVVDTEDAILVVHRDHVHEVKEAHRHIAEHYPELL